MQRTSEKTNPVWTPQGFALTVIPPPPPFAPKKAPRLELLQHVLDGDDFTTVYSLRRPTPRIVDYPFE